ncbi:hypothetical protein E5D57_006667 [Metarhizium anisopliae]|nr:hypothetical protein E5D57_006667 [Metarhizium anisopliae]
MDRSSETRDGEPSGRRGCGVCQFLKRSTSPRCGRRRDVFWVKLLAWRDMQDHERPEKDKTQG